MSPDHPPVSRRDSATDKSEAEEHLKYIHDVMARSGSFTAVPGWGMVAAGTMALITAYFASAQQEPGWFLKTWIIGGTAAACIGLVTLLRKTRSSGVSLRSGPGRKYILSLVPPLVAALVLTVALWVEGSTAIVPEVWLLIYGAGTVTGGAHSVRAIPALGMCHMALGTMAVLASEPWNNLLLATGFGGLHILFGVIIARKHGG